MNKIRAMGNRVKNISFLQYIFLFYIVITVYVVSNGNTINTAIHFSLLANAFLHGHLYVANNNLHLQELIFQHNHYYIVFPPMPAFFLLPFVFFFGVLSPQIIVSIILGAVNVVLAYAVFIKLYKRTSIAWWMSILYAFGTVQWFHATAGSSWYFAHIVALFFIWLALLEILTKQRLFLIGLCIGAAYISRLPTIGMVFFVFVYCFERFIKNRSFQWKEIFLFGLGLFPAEIINAIYNYARFGVFIDAGYNFLPIHHEPWYRYGLISFHYIPIHIKEMFTAMPVFISRPPYIIPSLFALAIWITTPAFVFILRAPFTTKLCKACIAGVIAVALPGLLHGGNGFTQFGYRYTLDYLPFLLLLTSLGLRNRLVWWSKLLIVISIGVNLWGIILIRFLHTYYLMPYVQGKY